MARELPLVTHVTLTPARGTHREPVNGVHQFHQPEDAAAFAVKMRDLGYDVTLATGPLKTQAVKARTLSDSDHLADGVMITHLYFGRTKVRVTGIKLKTARRVRRAYYYDQLVEIEHR